MKYDIVIIGAGITGTMLARKLSMYNLRIAVVDKENDIANGATMANSAIVHTGYDPEEGTLKGKLNVLGARQYEEICHKLHCSHKTIGCWIAACGTEEEKHLSVLAERAVKRDIPHSFISSEDAHRMEPNLSDSVTSVLSFPTTAVIYPWEVAVSCMENAVNNGADLYLNQNVTSIDHAENGYTVHTDDMELETAWVINAAGVNADKIYKLVSPEQNRFRMKPKRGEYFVLDQDVHVTDTIVFPVPSAKGKGVLAVPTVYGNTLVGPNSDYIQGTEDNGNSFQGLEYVRKNISKTLKNVPLNRSIRTFAGLRPSSSSSDFIIEEAEDAPCFINAASIESPGLASAPAIADFIISIIKEKQPLTVNEAASDTIEKRIVMSELSEEEANRLIAENPLYGRIICRCERISEGEIIDCIRRTCGARSVKGIKKRVRPGMGKCQGGFCEPRVVSILARELGISPLDVVLDSAHSGILESENR